MLHFTRESRQNVGYLAAALGPKSERTTPGDGDGDDDDGDGNDDDDNNNALVFYAFACVLRARIRSRISAVGWCAYQRSWVVCMLATQYSSNS